MTSSADLGMSPKERWGNTHDDDIGKMVNSSTGHGAGCPCHVCEHEGGLVMLAATKPVGARASIVAFLNAERQKYENAYNDHTRMERTFMPAEHRIEYDLKTQRLDAKVSLLCTLIAYIERGDDMGPR